MVLETGRSKSVVLPSAQLLLRILCYNKEKKKWKDKKVHGEDKTQGATSYYKNQFMAGHT
jgi:hypothetical protein